MTLADGEPIEAEAVVCAIPAGPLRAVEITGLSDERLASLRALRHSLAAKLVVAYEESFWQRNGQNGLAETEWRFGSTWPQGQHVLSLLVPPERLSAFMAAPAAARRQVVLDGLVALYGEPAAEPSAMFERAWGRDPYTLGYITGWAPGDLMRVGPLHGTHEPPFYVAGSDHWVAGLHGGRGQDRPPRRRGRAGRTIPGVTASRSRCRCRVVRRLRPGLDRGQESLAQAEVAGQGRLDRPARALQRDRAVADQRAHPEAVEQGQNAVGHLVGVAALELAVGHPGRDLVGKPRVHARVELLGHRAQLRVAHRPQPQLDPQHPVLAQ